MSLCDLTRCLEILVVLAVGGVLASRSAQHDLAPSGVSPELHGFFHAFSTCSTGRTQAGYPLTLDASVTYITSIRVSAEFFDNNERHRAAITDTSARPIFDDIFDLSLYLLVRRQH
jgi:hypothetical protein